MALQLFFLPKGVEVNGIDKALIVYYFTKGSNIILVDEIKEYTATKINTKSTNYEGILVHTKNGRKYLFANFNLKDYTPIKSFLEDYKIPFIGNEKFKNISYFISFFKYR